MRIKKLVWHLIVAGLALLALGTVLLLPPSRASAQDLPSVYITTVQTSVAEGQDATFRLARTGSTSSSLNVWVRTFEPSHPDISGEVNPSVQIRSVNFNISRRTALFTVTADLDAVLETSDSLTATVFALANSPYQVGSLDEASVTITDVAPEVSIIANQATVTEGDTATFTLTRTGSTTRAQVVNVSVSDPGSYLRGNHWQPDPVLPTTATFQVGSSTATISLHTKDDLRDIPDNNLTVTVSSGTGHFTVGDANSASIVVTDNDVAPTLTLSSDSTSVEEGETFVLTLNITGGSETSLQLDVGRGYKGQVLTESVTLDGSGDQRSWSVAYGRQ